MVVDAAAAVVVVIGGGGSGLSASDGKKTILLGSVFLPFYDQ